MESDTKAWYLLQSKPRQEALAQQNLQRQNFNVFLPLCSLRKRIRGKYQSVIEPLFSRYLFVQLDSENDNWGPIRSTYGVSNLVYFGSSPGLVPDRVVSSLKQKSDNDCVIELKTPEPQPGDRVRLMEGVGEGLEGIFHSVTGKERAEVLVNYLGKRISLNVKRECVTRI